MTNDEIVQLCRLIEAEVPVERWIVDGVQVWPLFRAQLRTDNFFMFQRGAATAVKSSRFQLPRIPLGPLPNVARNTVAYARAQAHDRAAGDRLRPVDAVLYSDGASFLRLEGKYFDRFCDPIRDRLDARHKRSLMLTPLGRFHQPRHSPSVYVQPRLDVAQVRAALRGRLGRPTTSELPGFSDAIRIARAAFPNAVVRDEAYLGRAAGYIHAFQEVHEKLLDVTQPRVVFIVSYYGSEAMALIRACRRRGIATVDVQHGCINEAHWAYAHWSRLPEGGLELLPKYFFVWSETEAKTIRAWSDASHGAHAPVVAGNMFLACWRDGSSRLVQASDARFRLIARQLPPNLAHVLYTTNGFETDAELAVLRDAIQSSRDRLFWWVRVHPAAPQSRSAIEAALSPCAGTYRIDPGDTSLYGVLRHMAAHVTEASTTVIEAAELGVPTVLLSRVESVMYRDQIDRGWAVVIEEGQDLASAVVSVLGKSGRPADGAGGPDPLDVVFA